MRPKLDQFFIDRKYGRLKFSGYDERGNYLFSTYEKASGPGWAESTNSFTLNPTAFLVRYEQGIMKESFPPI